MAICAPPRQAKGEGRAVSIRDLDAPCFSELPDKRGNQEHGTKNQHQIRDDALWECIILNTGRQWPFRYICPSELPLESRLSHFEAPVAYRGTAVAYLNAA